LVGHWPDRTVLLTGGSESADIAGSLCSMHTRRVVNAVGRLSLLGIAALVRRCSVFIGNDTGPTHLAAAVGCPVVVLSKHPRGGNPFSPNAPERFAPVGPWSRVLRPEPLSVECRTECCKPYAHCINGIAVEEVVVAIRAALEWLGVAD
jgi:heptosyltransferase-2